MKRLLLMLIVLATALVLLGYAPKVEVLKDRVVADRGYLIDLGGIYLMYAAGSPYEIGVQQALLLEHLNPDSEGEELQKLDPFLQKHEGFSALEWAFKRFYFDAKMGLEIVRNIPQEYLEEIRGYADTMAPGNREVFQSLIRSNAFQELAFLGCTSFAAWGESTEDGRMLHARNLDFTGLGALADFAFISIIEPDNGYPFAAVQYPTQVGLLHGMNSQGITVSVDYSIATSQSIMLDGISWPFLIRRIVQYASTIDEAIEIIKSSPGTIGLLILISDAKTNRAAVVEVNASEYTVREGRDYIFAANRYLSDFMKNFQAPIYTGSYLRENRLQELLLRNKGSITPAIMASFLRDKYEPGSADYNNFEWAIDVPGSVVSIVFDPSNSTIYASRIKDWIPAPDNTLHAVSLERALAGEDPQLREKDILPPERDGYTLAWLEMARSLMERERGNYDEASARIDGVLELYPQAAAVLKESATYDIMFGDFEKARTKYQMIAENPEAKAQTRREALVYLGALQDIDGHRGQALAYYRQALQLKVDEIEYFYDNSPVDRYHSLAMLGMKTALSIEKGPSDLYGLTGNLPIVRELFDLERLRELPAPLSAQFAGKNVGAVRYLGIHKTDPKVLKAVLRIDPGDTFNPDKLKIAELKLRGLGALQSQRLTVSPAPDDKVDVILRISEGFGLYLDPVEHIINTAIGLLLEKKITVGYYNTFGKLANVRAFLSWGPTKEKGFGISLPIAGLPSNFSYRNYLKIEDVTWGKYDGSKYTLKKNEITAGLAFYLTSKDVFTIGMTYTNDTVKELDAKGGLSVVYGNYLNPSLTYTRTWPSLHAMLPYRIKLSANASILWEFITKIHYRTSARLEAILTPIDGFTVKPYAAFGAVSPDTPFEYWLNTGSYPSFAGATGKMSVQKVAYTGVEFRLQFSSGIFGLFLIDFGKAWQDSTDWSFAGPIMDIGIGGGYRLGSEGAFKAIFLFDPLNLKTNFFIGVTANY